MIVSSLPGTKVGDLFVRPCSKEKKEEDKMRLFDSYK